MTSKFWLSLFMIPFLAVGLGMGYLTVRELRQVEAARSWVEAPAEISSCVLHRHRGSKGGSTYRVEAHYTYAVDGRRHQSSRVSFYTGSDNIGQFHQRTFRLLEAARTSKKSVPCWVNPARPEEAVLVRDLRPEMMAFQLLFVLAFGGISIGILVGLLFSVDSKRLSNGNIRMRKANLHQAVLIGAALADGATGWLLWKVIGLLGLAGVPWYLWLFAIPGGILTGYGTYLWMRASRFGVSELMISSSVLRLGNHANFTLLIPKLVQGDFKGVLSCTHQYTTGSGKHRHTHHDILWQAERTSGCSPTGAEMTHVNFMFDLPTEGVGVHPTKQSGSTKYYWRLVVTSDMPGVDFRAEFDLFVEV